MAIKIAILTGSEARQTELGQLLGQLGMQPVGVPSPEAETCPVWLIDTCVHQDGIGRLWSNQIPSAAWVLALVEAGQEEAALEEGADDVCAFPCDQPSLRARLLVGLQQHTRLAPVWQRRSLADRLPGPVMKLDDRGMIGWANPALCKLLAAPLSAVVGKYPTDFAVPEDRNLARLLVADFVIHNPGRSLSLRMVAADGRVGLVEWALTFDLDGESLLAIGTDLSRIEEAEQNAHQWQRTWAHLADSLNLAVVALKGGGEVASVSAPAGRALGLQPHEAASGPLQLRLEPEAPAPWCDTPALAGPADEPRQPVRLWNIPPPPETNGAPPYDMVVLALDVAALPLPREPIDWSQAADQPAGPAASDNISDTVVLVVERHDGIRVYLQRVARSVGFDVVAAESVAEAELAIEELGDRIGVVFTEDLPGEATLLASCVRGELGPPPPMYLLSDQPKSSHDAYWQAQGAHDVLLKPFGLSEVRSILERIAKRV